MYYNNLKDTKINKLEREREKVLRRTSVCGRERENYMNEFETVGRSNHGHIKKLGRQTTQILKRLSDIL